VVMEAETAGDGAKGPWRMSAEVIVVGVASALAALAAVGVSGDLLTRFSRNHPALLPGLLAAALVTGAYPLVVALWSRHRHGAVAVCVVTAICSGALFFGSQSVGDRDRPSVTMSYTTRDGNRAVAVSAHAGGLRSTESMAVRLLGFVREPGFDPANPFSDIADLCGGFEMSIGQSEEAATDNGKKPNATILARAKAGRVLTRQHIGPDGSGEAKAEIELPVDAQVTVVCAYAGLTDRDLQNRADTRVSVSFLNLSSDT
jgi:hypothetical protein